MSETAKGTEMADRLKEIEEHLKWVDGIHEAVGTYSRLSDFQVPLLKRALELVREEIAAPKTQLCKYTATGAHCECTGTGHSCCYCDFEGTRHCANSMSAQPKARLGGIGK
jgi:hypothetical protein